MDPVTAAGLVLSVAGLAGQVFSGCISGIQFIITAKDLPKECQYLNLRLRMEQQRLFAWSETAGLLDHIDPGKDNGKERNTKALVQSNAFGLHRSTVLDLLLQIKLLFEEFEIHQKRHKKLQVTMDQLSWIENPDGDSPTAEAPDNLVPVTTRRQKYIDTAMNLYKKSNNVQKRLRWAAIDKDAFESLLIKFSTLNDSITSYLDAKMQSQIYHTTQDTNRGVLQLHHQVADLQQLVKATLVLNLRGQIPKTSFSEHLYPEISKDVLGFELLAELARFKAFEKSIDSDEPFDDLPEYELLDLGKPNVEKETIRISKSQIKLHRPAEGKFEDFDQSNRCEAAYERPDGLKQKVWVEWKEYDWQPQGNHPSPLIIDRVSMLAMLLHHRPKPANFRVPHCIGYFDNNENGHHSSPINSLMAEEEENDFRIGFVFEKPPDVHPSTAPTSLLELLKKEPKPRVTERVKLASAVANCILYLHSVNWLHKGLRSHNIMFFKTKETGKIDYSKPYLSGFDFARPARPEEQTEIPGYNAEHNLYRHPNTQGNGPGPRESFRKSFDIYSFGVVLVELAHWDTIDKLLGIDLENTKGRPKTAQGIRAKLLEDASMEGLGANMGEVYEMVAKKCLVGGKELGIDEKEDETKDNHVAARLSKKFYEDVVKRLEDINV